MKEKCRVLVVGAGSNLGFCIVQRLIADACSVTATYRTDRPGLIDRLKGAGAVPARLDLVDTSDLSRLLDAADAVVFIPILTVSAGAARLLSDDQRAVFFSSNNVAIDNANPLYKGISQSEEVVRKAAPQSVILRPTMIYGHPDDHNLSRLMRALRRFPIMPRPSTGALQQPVFFRDLADVAVDALSGMPEKGETIAVAGPDVLTYRQLFRAVAKAARTRNLFLPVPISALIVILSLMPRLGMTVPVSLTQLKRANLEKRPRGANVVITKTPLETGLTELARAMRS